MTINALKRPSASQSDAGNEPATASAARPSKVARPEATSDSGQTLTADSSTSRVAPLKFKPPCSGAFLHPAWFPHIFDTIISMASAKTLLVLGATSRAMRCAVDIELSRHLVLKAFPSQKPGSPKAIYVMPGALKLQENNRFSNVHLWRHWRPITYWRRLLSHTTTLDLANNAEKYLAADDKAAFCNVITLRAWYDDPPRSPSTTNYSPFKARSLVIVSHPGGFPDLELDQIWWPSGLKRLVFGLVETRQLESLYTTHGGPFLQGHRYPFDAGIRHCPTLEAVMVHFIPSYGVLFSPLSERDIWAVILSFLGDKVVNFTFVNASLYTTLERKRFAALDFPPSSCQDWVRTYLGRSTPIVNDNLRLLNAIKVGTHGLVPLPPVGDPSLLVHFPTLTEYQAATPSQVLALETEW